MFTQKSYHIPTAITTKTKAKDLSKDIPLVSVFAPLKKMDDTSSSCSAIFFYHSFRYAEYHKSKQIPYSPSLALEL